MNAAVATLRAPNDATPARKAPTAAVATAITEHEYLLEGHGPLASTGVLLIHGLTGTPNEMRLLAKGLHRAGFTVLAVQLAGHCGTQEDLIATRWQDWAASARRGAERLAQHTGQPVIACGLSMGALLALALAIERPAQVAGVVALSTTFRYDGWSIPGYTRLAFLLPLFLGRVLGYSSSEVGTTMVVSGLAMFATGPFAGRLVRKLDARVLMFGGFMLCAWGMWEARVVTDDWGFWNFASVQAFRGVGVMLAMIASQQVTMATLPPHMVKNASGLVNLSRNVGGAFGLAILNTSLTSNTALHMSELTSAIGQGDQAMRNMMAGMAQRFAGSIDPAASAMKAIYGMLQKQATTMAFGDAFALLAILCAGAAFVTLAAQPVKAQAGAPPSDVH